MLSILKDKAFLAFVVKFLVTFFVCYFTTLAIIGLAAPEGRYSPFVEKYLDYVSWWRSSLLFGTKYLLQFFGVETYLANKYNIKQVNGRGIVIVYECVGYGILSFWTAFLVALKGRLARKIIWWFIGFSVLWILNVIRLSLLLVVTNKGWTLPLGWDHHTWFSIFAYGAILVMLYYFDSKNESKKKPGIKTGTTGNQD